MFGSTDDLRDSIHLPHPSEVVDAAVATVLGRLLLPTARQEITSGSVEYSIWSFVEINSIYKAVQEKYPWALPYPHSKIYSPSPNESEGVIQVLIFTIRLRKRAENLTSLQISGAPRVEYRCEIYPSREEVQADGSWGKYSIAALRELRHAEAQELQKQIDARRDDESDFFQSLLEDEFEASEQAHIYSRTDPRGVFYKATVAKTPQDIFTVLQAYYAGQSYRVRLRDKTVDQYAIAWLNEDRESTKINFVKTMSGGALFPVKQIVAASMEFTVENNATSVSLKSEYVPASKMLRDLAAHLRQTLESATVESYHPRKSISFDILLALINENPNHPDLVPMIETFLGSLPPKIRSQLPKKVLTIAKHLAIVTCLRKSHKTQAKFVEHSEQLFGEFVSDSNLWRAIKTFENLEEF